MPNSELAIRCTVTTQDRPEGIHMKDDDTWRSDSGGWLKAQSGTWIQASTSGVVLNSHAGEKIAYLQGLIFATAPSGSTGVFKHEARGEAGTWLVVS